MRVTVTISDEMTADYKFDTDLIAFVADNADGLDCVSPDVIEADIRAYGDWRCGGGSAPLVIVRAAA